MKTKFVTFGAGKYKNYHSRLGSADFIKAGKRLINQVEKLKVFDETKLYTDTDLKNDSEFWGKHKDFIEKNSSEGSRGYGYWIWKPYIIKKSMETMKDGDILMYADCGSTMTKNKRNIISAFNIVKKDYILASKHHTLEKQYHKMDLIVLLGMKNSKHIETQQRQATAEMFFVCDKTRKLVNEWYNICCNYHMIDDTPSIEPNLPGNIEHRHDQSVFSLLTKKYNLFSSKSITPSCVFFTKKRY